MKHARYSVLLALIVAVGASVMARVDWLREAQRTRTETLRTGERLVGLLALHPLEAWEDGPRNLLAKTLVEQASGAGVAYLLVHDLEEDALLAVGDPALLAAADARGMPAGPSGAPASGGHAAERRGGILEFTKPIVQPGGTAGLVRLGLRIPSPPPVSPQRISSVAAVAFLMVAAMVVGYYAILLAVRRTGRAHRGTPGTANVLSSRPGDRHAGVLSIMEHMDIRLSETGAALRQARERIAELSSGLGVAAFEKEQAYRMLDGLDFGILILDAHERVAYVNHCLLGLLGIRRGDAQGRGFSEAIHDPPLAALLERTAAGADGDHASVDTRFEETAPGRYFRLRCRPLLDSTGDGIGRVITVEDSTSARRADKAQEDFVAQVAHELFTPLTSMKAIAEMLMLSDVTDPEMQKECFNTINEETDRLTGLIKNLLSVSKMEAGSLGIERSLVRTDWLLDQCLPAIEGAARAKNITISKQLPDRFPTIMGDKDLLKVVLVNILGNAVKYTPEQGALRVALLEQDHQVFIEVSDTGHGIAADDLPRVFEKFFRGSGDAVRSQSGSGMGLATAMQIVKLHGGGIDVTSEPGKGACFTVRVPTEVFSLEKA